MPRRNQQQNNQAVNDDGDAGRHIPNEIPGGSKSFLCCVPTGCVKGPIREENLWEAVKIVCNNDACTLGPYMHKECFEEWEETVLTFLRSCGRARSWSEKQRLQNLWTKKGYDLAFKACGCSCGRGHLKKDLNWLPPRPRINHENDAKKRKRKNKQNALPVLGQGMLAHHNHNNNNNNHAGSPPRVNGVAPAGAHAMVNNNGQYQQPQQQQPIVVSNGGVQEPPRPRTSSMSSTGSSTCSPGSGSTSGIDSPSSPVHSTGGQGRRKSSNFEFFGDKARHGSGGNGGFIKRIDYTSFNVLPRHKINSYHIKMEDDGHGNDEIRAFILGTLGAAKVNKVSCCLCYTSMSVFDRYPLIDGTFFLSPRQHSNHCLEVKRDNRIEYLSSVCMGCLEGWGSQLKCRGCAKPWDGSHLLLGSMYTYDIFSSDPCCAERLKCTRCSQPVINPEHRLAFFSDYSRPYPCQVCKYIDYHFAKPLSVAYAPKKPTPPPIAAIIHQHSVNATRQAAAAAAMSNGVILAHPSGAHYNPYHPNFSSPYHLTRSASIGSAPPKTATPSPPPHPGPAHARPPLQQQFSLPLPGAMMRPRQPDSPPLLSVVPNMRIPPPPLFSSVPPAARLYQQPPPIHRRHCTGLLGDIQHQMSSLAIVAES